MRNLHEAVKKLLDDCYHGYDLSRPNLIDITRLDEVARAFKETYLEPYDNTQQIIADLKQKLATTERDVASLKWKKVAEERHEKLVESEKRANDLEMRLQAIEVRKFDWIEDRDKLNQKYKETEKLNNEYRVEIAGLKKKLEEKKAGLTINLFPRFKTENSPTTYHSPPLDAR